MSNRTDEQMISFFDDEIYEAMITLRDCRNGKLKGVDASKWQDRLEGRQQARREYQSRIDRKAGA